MSLSWLTFFEIAMPDEDGASLSLHAIWAFVCL